MLVTLLHYWTELLWHIGVVVGCYSPEASEVRRQDCGVFLWWCGAVYGHGHVVLWWCSDVVTLCCGGVVLRWYGAVVV